MVPLHDDGTVNRAAQYRARYEAHRTRHARAQAERTANWLHARRALDAAAGANAVRAAIARARAKKTGGPA